MSTQLVPAGQYQAHRRIWRRLVQTARLCSRQTCQREATVTLHYSYADSTALIDALSEFREPHAYDLCDDHAARLTAPQGWRVVYKVPVQDTTES